MSLSFFKTEGLGNDFVLLDRLDGGDDDFPELARILCERRHGVGADGLLVVCASGQADARMRIFNADGTEAQMCGNGIRCAGLYLNSIGYGDRLRIETLAGIKELTVNGNEVTVDMGAAIWSPERVPVVYPGDRMLEADVSIVCDMLKVSAVSMGNPHGVVFVDRLIRYPVRRYGRLLERHEMWPERANIEFVLVMDSHHLSMRAWERGVGETAACGTGACAAAAVAVATERAEFPIDVRLPGGVLRIDCDDAGHLMMTGPANICFTGNYIR